MGSKPPTSPRTDMLMCSPLPAKFGRGLGEKSAHRPLRAAMVRTTAQKVTALSAAERGSE